MTNPFEIIIESQNIEYKSSWRDEYLKWICGFANAFFRCGEVEAWGRGIGKIVNGAIAEKLLPPVFDASFGGLMVTFFNSPAAQLKEAGVDERGIAIVNYVLTEKKVTNSDVQRLLNVSKPTATRLLTSLSDYLVVTGTRGKGTFYSVKGLTIGSLRTHAALRMMEDRNFTILVISELPKKTTPRTPIGQAKEPLLLQTFWDNLPDEFEAKDFKEIASSIGLTIPTAERYIRARTGTRMEKVMRGKYRKTAIITVSQSVSCIILPIISGKIAKFVIITQHKT